MNIDRRKLAGVVAATALILVPTATAARIGMSDGDRASGEVPVYDGQMASGFLDWSWADTDHSSTIEVDFDDSDALFLSNPDGVELGADPRLVFEVTNRADTPTDLEVTIFGTDWSSSSQHQLVVPAGGPWRHSLSVGSVSTVHGIWWREAGAATSAELGFGSIVLESTPSTPEPPEETTPSTDGPTTVPSTPPTTGPTTTPPTTSDPSAPPTVPTTAGTTVPEPPTPTVKPPSDDTLFFEDFVADNSLGRFDFDIYHRDDFVNADNTSWPGDHAVTGPGDLCGPPEDKRTITRGDRRSGFNDEWIYRCVPMGEHDLAHIMTSIGDTSGYSIGAFSPKQPFTGVREVRWDVNITELGNRQFTEVKLIPVDSFDFANIPCAIEWLPCDTSLHRELGSLGVSFQNHEMTINDGTDSRSMTSSWGGEWMEPGDPAVDSIRTRRTHFFRDNGDGTLSFGIEKEDGSYHVESRNGRFPDGPVRVVFADHNYTPLKAENGRPSTFSWHWDDITVLG